MTKSEISNKYDGKSISEIEHLAKDASSASLDKHKEFISILFYLQDSKRFRENKAYKDSTFQRYVLDMYGMTMNSYNTYRFAYFSFPDEVERLGVGVVKKIRAKCGTETVAKVVDEIDSNKKLTPEKIDTIIEKYAKPEPYREPRLSYADLSRMVDQKDLEIIDLKKKLKDMTEQRDKLLACVKRINRAVAVDNDVLRPACVA